jgi:hypothetical protein
VDSHRGAAAEADSPDRVAPAADRGAVRWGDIPVGDIRVARQEDIPVVDIADTAGIVVAPAVDMPVADLVVDKDYLVVVDNSIAKLLF